MRSTQVVRNISRMLDLGGMPPASTSRSALMDASKNCKVRCLAFDFDLLTRTVADSQHAAQQSVSASKRVVEPATASTPAAPVLPDVSMLQQMANLLNVKLGESVTAKRVDDDLSALGEVKSTPVKKAISNPVAGDNDIRNKYAAKLQNRGGIAGIELAKYQAVDSHLKGDAAGHLAARAMAVKAGSSSETSQKWMAHTGTGALLQYVTIRSMKIALLPIPGNGKAEQEGNRMEEFTKQIPQVAFDVVLKEGETVAEILQNLLSQVSMDPLTCLVVSDRDDYLRTAKDAGMTTCRVRAHANAPRGNTTAHYTVTSMAEVQDVVNEINGISFKAVASAR